ncbi:hypothetical protein GCM10011581_32270 [Saccharopolyspora subtropica]|nr:hypothetical protein GCM10011581_32270 [Saccharopolyspora subtropica]
MLAGAALAACLLSVGAPAAMAAGSQHQENGRGTVVMSSGCPYDWATGRGCIGRIGKVGGR